MRELRTPNPRGTTPRRGGSSAQELMSLEEEGRPLSVSFLFVPQEKIVILTASRLDSARGRPHLILRPG